MEYKSISSSISSLAAVFGAVGSYLFGGWDSAIQTLFVFVVIDYLTGVLASGKQGELSSKAGLKGIGRKCMIFMFVTMGHMADLHLSDGHAHLFRDGVITFFIANEALSITENAGKMGVPIPEPIRRAVEIFKEKGGNK